MFENVLGQPVSAQLIHDIEAGVLAPAMLFSGSSSSGKGTAALELGRVISCENPVSSGSTIAPWDCGCTACSFHRLLTHPDMLCFGPRSFYAEIAASSQAMEKDIAGKLFFIRSVRKLLLRFNPVLWEDDPKASRISPLVNSLEEDINEIEQIKSMPDENDSAFLKLIKGITANAYKLEAEGISKDIPIGQIRRASWWSRLSPSGKGKIIIIENADRMQNEARNSLLKILEEPPDSLSLVLTTQRHGSIIPTILSRLRVYRFNKREVNAEDDVIRRVFRDSNAEKGIGINRYLDSFLPVSGAALENLAAFFTASVAYKAVMLAKKKNLSVCEETIILGRYTAPIAEKAGYGRPVPERDDLVGSIMDKAGKFEIRTIFTMFLYSVLDQVSNGLRQGDSSFLPRPEYREIWKKRISWAENAAVIYNLMPQAVLEKLFLDLSLDLSLAEA